MTDKINIDDIYDKNINFLIGSGASSGLFPTLELNIKTTNDKKETIETLATYFNNQPKVVFTLLFMHYYKECIEPVMTFKESSCTRKKEKAVIENYKRFIKTILLILNRKKQFEKRCNIFTTNYDTCIALAADNLIKDERIDFIVNDGARGFSQRILHAKNYNTFTCQTGIFDRHHTDIPQLNLIHLHGSVCWQKIEDSIKVDYISRQQKIEKISFDQLKDFSPLLANKTKSKDDLLQMQSNNELTLSKQQKNDFWSLYNELPIVNPTKWKFHETVFEEHYYQMLRYLSYELEKPNSVFITFGFSFGDEHILNLVKRSLSNPTLQVFICCYNSTEKEAMTKKFSEHKNVKLITSKKPLTFCRFNKEIFIVNSNEETSN